MSQIEQNFRVFLAKRPEVERCYAEGLVNRRALARYLIKQGIVKNNEFEAAVAMLRRFDFKENAAVEKDAFKHVRFSMKDKIVIIDFEKEKALLQKLQKVIAHTNYDGGDTLKIVVGTSSIKVFLDDKNEKNIKDLLDEFKVKGRLKNISEISMLFSEEARASKGIVAAITRELAMHGIVVAELLTCSPELLIYVNEEQALKAYGVLKEGF